MQKFVMSLLAILMASSTASAVIFGVNTHSNTNQNLSDLMKARNFKSARMDLTVDSDSTGTRAQASRIRANGGTVEVSLQISYQWDNSCNQNFSTVQQDAYNQTAAIVNVYKDVIYDYELLNEITLRPETQGEVAPNNGTSASAYANHPCYKTMTSVLLGMSQAIHDIKKSSGYPLRVILGTVGRDFGFLSYMQQQGVVFDVVGFHVYPRSGDASLLSDTWYGSGGPFAQLATFNLPVHVNEFNCGEIYDGGYDNTAGSSETTTCFQSYKNHIPEFLTQTKMNLESVHLYEIFDEPSASTPENHFGLMYDINTPKVHLYIITAFAGGTLSTSEQQAVTSLGILTSAQIASYATAGRSPASAPTPTPAPPKATPTPTPAPPKATPTPTPAPPKATPTPTPAPLKTTPTPTPAPPKATPTPVSSMPTSSTITFANYTATQYVTSLYELLLGREPDTSSLLSYVASINQGVSRIDVQNSFLSSAEFLARSSLKPAASVNSLSNDTYVRTLYIVLLNRDPDASGLSNFTTSLAQGVSRTRVLKSFMTSAEYLALHPSASTAQALSQSKRRK